MPLSLGRLSVKSIARSYFLRYMKNAQLVRQSAFSENTALQVKRNHAHKQFLTLLETAVGSAYEVKGRAQVFDLLQLEKDSAASRILMKMFSEYYFDYVVCRRSDQQVVCVVELAQDSRLKNSQQRRLEKLQHLLQHYCAAANLPRLVVAQKRNYNLPELIERFEGVIDANEISA